MVHVYFKDDIRKAVGYEMREWNNKGRPAVDHYFKGTRLYNENNGRLYFFETNLMIKVGSDFMPYVDYYSYRERVFGTGRRESGIYKRATAEAIVTWEVTNGESSYLIAVKADKFEDLESLCQDIMIGKALPEDSLQGEQIGLSRKELEMKMKVAGARITELEDSEKESRRQLDEAVKAYEKKIEEHNNKVDSYVDRLKSAGVPLLLRGNVIFSVQTFKMK